MKHLTMSTNKKIITILFAAALLLLSIDVMAHRPIGIGGEIGLSPDQAIVVEDIAVSQVAYRAISSDMPQLWMAFEGQAGESLDAQLGIPAIEGFENYRPSMAVVGPGLPKNTLPFDIPQGMGAIVLESKVGETEIFYEPFSDTNSLILGNLELNLPVSGQYFVVAYHPDGVEGKLWIALGTLEKFGASDMGKMPEWLKSVREFHEVEGQAPLINYSYVTLLGLFAAATFIVWGIFKK
jgi:hypothetical protein